MAIVYEVDIGVFRGFFGNVIFGVYNFERFAEKFKGFFCIRYIEYIVRRNLSVVRGRRVIAVEFCSVIVILIYFRDVNSI